MANAITARYDVHRAGSYTINGRQANSLLVITGTMSYADLTTSGNSWTFPEFSRIVGVFCENSPGGQVNVYDITNKTVAPYAPQFATATIAGAQGSWSKISSTTAVAATMTGIHFMALGYQ